MENYSRKKPCSHDQRILMPSGRPVFAQIGAADVPKQITSMSVSCDGKDAPLFRPCGQILNDRLRNGVHLSAPSPPSDP